MTLRNGLDSLFRPEGCVLVQTDHRPYRPADARSHRPRAVVNYKAGIAMLAKSCKAPTIVTSVIASQEGVIVPHITDVLPGQAVIDRTLVDTWKDKAVVDAVKATGRTRPVGAAGASAH